MSSFRVLLAVILYLGIGTAALYFLPSDWARTIESSLHLLTQIAATLTVLFGLLRLIIDKLKDAPASRLLTWFFVVFAGASLFRESWVMVGFMGLILLALLLFDFDPAPKNQTEDRSEGVIKSESQENQEESIALEDTNPT